jgi:hypothetical protein
VQTIRIPVPFSGSASSLGKIGTGTRNSGVTACFPNRSRDEAALPALHPELDVVKGTAHHAVIHLRLGDGGLEVHVPHGGGVRAVEVTLLPEVHEAELRQPARPLPDGLVLLGPVDRQAHAAEEALESLLVLRRHALT